MAAISNKDRRGQCEWGDPRCPSTATWTTWLRNDGTDTGRICSAHLAAACRALEANRNPGETVQVRGL